MVIENYFNKPMEMWLGLAYIVVAAALFRSQTISNAIGSYQDIFFIVHLIVSFLFIHNCMIIEESFRGVFHSALLIILSGFIIMEVHFFTYFYDSWKAISHVIYVSGYRLGSAISSLF